MDDEEDTSDSLCLWNIRITKFTHFRVVKADGIQLNETHIAYFPEDGSLLSLFSITLGVESTQTLHPPFPVRKISMSRTHLFAMLSDDEKCIIAVYSIDPFCFVTVVDLGRVWSVRLAEDGSRIFAHTEYPSRLMVVNPLTRTIGVHALPHAEEYGACVLGRDYGRGRKLGRDVVRWRSWGKNKK